MNANGTFLNTKGRKTTLKYIYLVHTLQTIVSDLKPLDDFHLNLHELNILNLLTNIRRVKNIIAKVQTCITSKQK